MYLCLCAANTPGNLPTNIWTWFFLLHSLSEMVLWLSMTYVSYFWGMHENVLPAEARTFLLMDSSQHLGFLYSRPPWQSHPSTTVLDWKCLECACDHSQSLNKQKRCLPTLKAYEMDVVYSWERIVAQIRCMHTHTYTLIQMCYLTMTDFNGVRLEGHS